MTSESHQDQSVLWLRVYPNAARNEIAGFTDGVLQVKIAAPPVKGKANKELITFLSKALGVSKSSLNIVKGHTSRNKAIAVAGMSYEKVLARLPSKPSSSSGGATSR